MTRRSLRRLLGGVLATLVGLALVPVAAAPASAASYRYWTYWHGTASGAWTFAPVGASYQPPDGSVEGWRFAVSGTAASTQPRMAAGFAVICAGQTPTTGNKLVALVVDYGLAADAPGGEQPPFTAPRTFCAQVAASATAYAILQQYSPGSGGVRSAGGLVCGIHGYPAHECGVVVGPSPAPTSTHGPSVAPTTRPAPTASAPGRSGWVAAGSKPAPTAGTASAASPSGTATAVAGPGTSSTPGPDGVAQTTFPAVQAMGAEAAIDNAASGSPPWPTVAGMLLVALLAAAALVRSRRSRYSGRR